MSMVPNQSEHVWNVDGLGQVTGPMISQPEIDNWAIGVDGAPFIMLGLMTCPYKFC